MAGTMEVFKGGTKGGSYTLDPLTRYKNLKYIK
jgi:hypothetical protein